MKNALLEQDSFSYAKQGCAMDFLKYISTDHSAYTQDAPLRSTIQLTKGRLVGGWIYFPSGPAAKLHLIVKRGLHQILPANTDGNYALDDCVVPIFINLELDGPPLALDVLTWNDSIIEAHALTICFFLDPWSDPRERRSWLARLLARTEQGD